MPRIKLIESLTDQQKVEIYNKQMEKKRTYAREYFSRRREKDPEYNKDVLRENTKKSYRENKELKLMKMKEKYIEKRLKLLEEIAKIEKKIEKK